MTDLAAELAAARARTAELEAAQIVAIDELRQRNAELAMINQIGSALARQLDVDKPRDFQAIIEAVGDRAAEALGVRGLSICIVDPKTKELTFFYWVDEGARNRDKEGIVLGDPLSAEILRAGRPLRIGTAEEAAARGTPFAIGDTESYLGVPIPVGDRTIGVFALGARERHAYSDADESLLTTMASAMGVGLENARLFEETNRLLAETRRQKQYFESLVDISPVAVVTMDGNEIVSAWNPAATRLFGYEPDDAIGRHIDDLLFLPDEREEGKATTRLADETGRAQLIGQRRRKDGGLMDVEIVLVPLEVDGEHTGYYAIYHDITELQAARREADTANAAKSTFLASMSHEIRTPMNAIIGMSGLLTDTPLDAEQRDFAETIRTSGEALLTIINDILDFSKIEAGRLELESQRFDLAATIEGALDVIGPLAAGKGLELAYSMDLSLPTTFVGDGGRLRQIVLNLLSNAVKFTDAGDVVLSVSGSAIDDASGSAPRRWNMTISIADTGIGIPQDKFGRLFQSFSQADASISHRYGGTGLGLAISRRLAELMDGSLVAHSNGIAGEGSTFTLALRLTESSEPIDAGAIAADVDLSGRRALVVDDNATNLRILVGQLERFGLDVTSTTSSRKARDLVMGRRRFDVVLTDLHMPDLDGLELASAVRTSRPDDAPPVIVLSSLGHRERDDERIGAFLNKPVKPAALREALVRVLGGVDVRPVPAPATRFVADPELGIRHPLRVLLAEDNAMNQKLALRLLRGMGYEADLAVDGFKVLDALDRQTYDVVFMDVQMPDLDGMEATRRIRQRWPGRPVRIVAMTANAMEGDRETCLAAGMDDYLSKPIRPELLAAALVATPTLTNAADGAGA